MEEVEYCDPFDGKKYGYWMKIEHAGRYIFAGDFLKNQKDVSLIADVACATGYGVEFLSKLFNNIDGYDSNIDYLNIARKRKIKNASFINVDFNSKVKIERQYDAIVCFETIEHIDNTKNFMFFLKNSIKKGGYLILSVPNKEYEQVDESGNILYKYHKHIFSKEKICQLLEKNHFSVKEILGQSLCNQIVSKEHVLKTTFPYICDEKFLNNHDYSKKAICLNARIYAYPDDILIDKSYSYIFICEKE